MKYACLVYLEEKNMDALSQEESDRLTHESLAYDRELQRRGHFVFAQALQPTTTAVTVRVRSGKVSATDGPFAETKEHLGGLIVVEARDLNEAVQLATQAPMARVASLEVRPVLELTDPVLEEQGADARSA